MSEEIFQLVEYFWTFQGEGLNAGRRALFVRVPFCNLKCSWCDTEYNSFKKVSFEELKAYALSEESRFAVITGGEPTINKATPRLVEALKECGFTIAIESNGTFPIPYGIDFVTISPKRDANFEIHADAALKCHELKIVVDQDFDFEIARKFQEHEWTKLIQLSLSPEFGNLLESVQKIETFIRSNPRWRLSVQTHKFLGLR